MIMKEKGKETGAENFFKDLLIDIIEFWYVRGLTDNSENPK